MRTAVTFAFGVLSLAAVGGCRVSNLTFHCNSSSQCGAGGTCVSGYCAFSSNCPSGLRWDSSAGAKGGQCVPTFSPPIDMALPDIAVPDAPDMQLVAVADMATQGPDLAPLAMLTVDNASTPFGSVTQGKASASVQLTITNTGSGDAGTPMLSKVGDASDFQISTDCNGPLPAHTKCHVTVAFAPLASTAAGAKDIKLTVSASPGGDVHAELTGTSLTPGTISIMPDVGDCGSAPLNTQSMMPAKFTVRNGGTSQTGSLKVTLSDTTQFSYTGCNGVMLGANASCVITVLFKPQKRGSSVTSIEVDDGPTDAATASVKGVGLAPAMLSVSPPSFGFPSTPHAATSTTTQTFVVTNMGDVPTAALQASTITGTNGGSFAIQSGMDGCKGVALGGTPCSITVQFTPQASGTLSATLQINGSSPTPLATASLGGVGTPSWIREYSAAGGAGDSLTSIWAADAGHVWTVGNNGRILARNGNGTWSSQGLNTTDQYSLVTGSSASDVWIAANNGILHSTGGAFSSTGLGLSGQWVTGIMPFAANDVYALALTTGSSPSETLNHYTGSGSFVATSATIPVGTMYIWYLNDSDLYATNMQETISQGQPLYTSYVLYGSTSTGFSQSSVEDTEGGAERLGPFWGSGYTDIYCANWSGKALHSDGGPTFTKVTGAPDFIYAIWGSSKTDVYLVGLSGIVHGDGTTWGTPVKPKTLVGYGVTGTSANDVYVAGYDSDGVSIYHWF